jgi:predicted Zn-dependent protease
MVFIPLETFAPLSPVVSNLVVAANKNSAKGEIDSATTTIERAIRIEPRNATLFYKLAVLRLKQSKPRLAEDLAKKSALLASNDTALKKHSWLLIAKAREMQKNLQGAKEAKAKADKF